MARLKVAIPATISQEATMPNPPAFCPACGAIFPSPISIGGGQVTLIGNVTNCPRCGSTANILDGVFTATEGVLQVLAGPQFTRNVVRTLAILVERVAKNEISTQELARQTTEMDAELGEAVSKIIKSPWPIPILVILILFLQRCDFSISASVDINELWNQITRTETPAVILEDEADDPHSWKSGTDTQSSGDRPKIKHPDRHHKTIPRSARKRKR